MKAGDIKLSGIFNDIHRYEVPMFQRPYVWDVEDNWLPLWTDVSAAADAVIEEMRAEEWAEDPAIYFLGAVVLQPITMNPQRVTTSLVIDGQQRLTTLQILLAAARAVAQEVGAESTAGRFDNWIENNEKVVHENFPQDRFKLWPLPQDRDEYFWAVRGAGDEVSNPDKAHRVGRARDWFETQIRDWAGTDNPVGHLEALHMALEERMKLVRVTLEKSDDAQIIFEALNHRGVDLTNSDLVKNLLFRLVEQQGDHRIAEQLLREHWLPLDYPAWRRRVTTGRLRRDLLDLVIGFWLEIHSGKDVSSERLFDDFKKWILDSETSAAEAIRSIRSYADLYKDLLASPPDSRTAGLIERITVLKQGTPWPLILYLFHDESISAEERRTAVESIDSYIMRRAICNLTTKDYNNTFRTALTAAMNAAPGAAGTAVRDSLASSSATSRIWPTDGEFVMAMFNNYFYGLGPAKLRCFFTGIENHLRTARTESLEPLSANNSKLTVEHVLPQTWQTHWPLEDATEDAETERQQAVHSLGNLTLITGTLNSDVSNGPWEAKREKLRQHSLLRITAGSILSRPSAAKQFDDTTWSLKWDESRILIRGGVLMKEALQVWSRPEPAEPIEPIEDNSDE